MTDKVSANRNYVSHATDVTKSSEQSVNQGGQIPSNTIDRDNEPRNAHKVPTGSRRRDAD